ncbi:MAG TPA: 8-oxoguanine deaminase [Gammaproteobacteria bacterium]|nr:8-oxoguanine deaminase [Gammaproteobacteria bacterium]
MLHFRPVSRQKLGPKLTETSPPAPDRVVLVKNPKAVFGTLTPSQNPDDPAPYDASISGIVLKGNRVDDLLRGEEVYEGNIHQTVDATDLVVLPGLINTHHHFYQNLTRNLDSAVGKALFPWLRTLYPIWAELTPQDIEIAASTAIAELLLSGCTTTTDHHYVFNTACQHAIDLEIQIAEQLGIRMVATRGSMSLGESAGGLPPDALVEADARILAESERLISRWHDPNPLAMVQVALAPCSPFSVSRALMLDTQRLAEQHKVLLHTHLAETEDETQFCLDQYGCRPIEFLDQCGWLHKRAWFAHGIHFDRQEIELLGRQGCGVTHCPNSNMILGSGICPTDQLLQAGVKVALGVDGSASNNHSNLVQEIRQAYLLQRLSGSALTHFDALKLATSGGASVLDRPELGHLRPGAAADLALFKVDDLRFLGSQDPITALVTSGAHAAHHVMVNGQWRVKGGEILGLDLQKLKRTHRERSESLWARAGLSA